MGLTPTREELARAAEREGLDIDPDVLLAIVHRAFAPRSTMTAQEREFLLASGAPEDSFDPSRQAEARASLVARAAATADTSSPLLSTGEVAALIDKSERTVRRAAAAHDLYAIRSNPSGSLAFPSWQFVNGRLVPHLRLVLAVLPVSMHPLSVEGFMTSSQEELDEESPVAWLSRGLDPEPVVSLADSHART